MSAAAKIETRYISTTETAKLIRARLKVAFTDHKFSVRKTHHSSIDVTTTVNRDDREFYDKVNAELHGFQGQGFDGMIDMSFYKDSWLNPDGSAIIARHPGTVGSMGVYEPEDVPAPDERSELVHFGAHHVSLSHDWRNA